MSEPDQTPGADAVEAPLAPGEPDLPGPFSVGEWAKGFQRFMRGRPRVRLTGEVTNFSGLRSPGMYFELRDNDGAVPCAIWRNDYDKLDLPEGALADGVEMVVAGGPDYFGGGASSSPRFNFRVTYLRPAGEGDLLARLARLRKRFAEEGLGERQRLLVRPGLPKMIGVVTARDSAARADVVAGLQRRGWGGTVVFAHVPVQGAASAPKIAEALRELAEIEAIETIIVARGGGSLMDLWAFCDEALCRTVAMLRVPVIAAVGHETDSTLIDDVAAISCSTPTHAAAAAVGIEVGAARAVARSFAGRLARVRSEAVAARAHGLRGVARALAHHNEAQRRRLHQLIREVRASSARSLTRGLDLTAVHTTVLDRARTRSLEVALPDRRQAIERIAATLAAHDPDRVLDRGYAIVEADDGSVITSAAEARRARRFGVRFSDDSVAAEVAEDE